MKAKRPIIINLEKIDQDLGKKVFDFLSGATYALNGTAQKVANNIYVFAPESVDITAKLDTGALGLGLEQKVQTSENPWV